MAALYTFEDYSGSAPSVSDNPYDGLIEACHDNATEIQARYNIHRTTRTKQQKEKLLSPDFQGVAVDAILKRLEDPLEPDFEDHRHCLVFWARPPQKIKNVIAEIQRRLKTVAPNLWIMPQTSLHMTALEITHSLTSPEILSLVETLRPAMETITDYPSTHRARLVKPTLSYDAQALALSFLPAAGECCNNGSSSNSSSSSSSSGGNARTEQDDAYTYHHLRRDLFALATKAGVKVESRYVVPSAHLTIARFIESSDFEQDTGAGAGAGAAVVDAAKVAELVRVIEEINQWLEMDFWPAGNNDEQEETGKGGGGGGGGGGNSGIRDGGEWIVGEEKGLDFRQGALWYGGGGETVRLGKGF